MMFRRSLLLAIAAIAATSVAALPASAQRGRDLQSQWAGDQREQPRREVPLSTVIRDLRRQYGGQHLDASKVGDRYVIAWVTEEGRRLTIEVDTATGRTISVR